MERNRELRNRFVSMRTLDLGQRICVCVLGRVQLFATPWTVARQAPLPMELSRQKDEWVAISYFRGSSQPREQTFVSCIDRWILYH